MKCLQYTNAEKPEYANFSRTGRYFVLDPKTRRTPNLTVGKVFGALNAQRIVGELKALGPRFAAVRKDFARALYCPLSNIELKGEFKIALTGPVEPGLAQIIRESADYSLSKQARLKENFHTQSTKNSFLSTDASVVAHYESLGFGHAQAIMIPDLDIQLLVRLNQLRRLVGPLGIDITNWSMILTGGYDHEDGAGGEGGSSFLQQLDKPFLETYYSQNAELMKLVFKRRTVGGGAKPLTQMIEEDAAICERL